MNYQQFQPPVLNGRPTQSPLNREEQKTAFEKLKGEYFKIPEPTPEWSIPAIKEYKLSESEQLKAAQEQMRDRGFQVQAAALEDRLEEKKVADTIKTFYCRHEFHTVKAQFGILPVKYKICKKCQLVK
jgi:hypothetical protein